MNKTIFFLLSLSLILSCNKDDGGTTEKETFNPQTIEDVIASRDYYFTFYLNGELWYTRPKDDPKPTDQYWQTTFEFNDQKSSDGNYKLFSLEAIRWPNTNNPDEKGFHRQQTLHIYIYDIVSNSLLYPRNIDKLPYELNYTYKPDSLHNIFFENNFHSKDKILMNGSQDLIIHRKIDQLKLNIDKVERMNENGDLDPNGFQVVFGRIKGTFTNKLGQSINITDGQFKVRSGQWKNPKN